MTKLPSVPNLEAIPAVLHTMADAQHPLAAVFTLLWFRCQLIKGRMFPMRELAETMDRTAQQGGTVYLTYDQGWGIDAKLTVTVDETDLLVHKTYNLTTQVSWSSTALSSAQGLKAAKLHLEVAQLAAFLDGEDGV